MGLFDDFKTALAESPGRILKQQLQDTMLKLERANYRIRDAALKGFSEKTMTLIDKAENMSSKGQIDLGVELQKRARKTFDLDMSEGYALWLTGAFFESMGRPGAEACWTHQYLSEIVMNFPSD